MIGRVIMLVALIGTAAQAQNAAVAVAAVFGADGSGFSFGVENVVNVDVGDNPTFNQITVQLDIATGKKFDAMASSNVGKKISIQVCGREVFKPVIQVPLHGGVMILAGYTKARAQEIADVLTGRRSCDNAGS